MRTEPAPLDAIDARQLLSILMAVRKGDFSVRMPFDQTGMAGKVADALNDVIEMNERLTSEFARVGRVVGKEGKTAQRASIGSVGGGWAASIESVNSLIGDLMQPTTEVARVIGAVAKGDLTQTMVLEIDARPLTGEFLRTAKTVNTMVDQLGAFASEVSRVAREVGTEGKLGGRADVKGVAGTWKELTDNVNSMASNLTGQVRNIAEVTTAVANGDLSKKITVDVQGEILELKNTINTMVDQLNGFASEVTRVAREVGTEGELGGQAYVSGVSGTWKELTDNVNRLAANLTTWVRAIAEVATAVTTGDLTRSIAVDAAGEVAALKDNINQMILNLRDTTRINTEQDWLKTNVARFTRLLQGQRDRVTFSRMILSELAPLVNVQHGVFFINDADEGQQELKLLASYGYQERRQLSSRFRPGEGLVGQCVLEGQRILLTEVPGDYVRISSGLGEAPPHNIVVLPVLFEGEVLAVVELASFNRFSEIHLTFLDQLTESIGIVLNTLAASMKTEELLQRSQSLTQELQNQQEELQETNRRLEHQARDLQASEEKLKAGQEELQQINEELEEKAEQLSITSRYKSEFLANMSHELRTPLNSLLILSGMLADNGEGNLNEKQVQYAATVHSAGNDLLALINEVLDLAKVESGTMDLQVAEVTFNELRDYVDRNFRELAEQKGLEFEVSLDDNLPTAIETDPQRLQQVLRNLLSNAFKFTDAGQVGLSIRKANEGWNRNHPTLSRAESVIAFAVSDTGIGIPTDRHRLIFEAFQQADGTTSRKYGGTGLGLSISREIASLLEGEIKLTSAPGQGSTFTLFLPLSYASPLPRRTAPRTEEPRSRRSRGGRTAAQMMADAELEATEVAQSGVDDDRGHIEPNDQVLLIVEDDPEFARILLDRAHEKEFKGVVSLKGATAPALARRYRVQAITLDIHLPDVDGWAVLDRLKHDPDTRHIPVHIISATEEPMRGLKQGAIAHLLKPVSRESLDEALINIKGFLDRKMKRLLVVEDDEVQRNSIVELIGNGDIQTFAVSSGSEALEALKTDRFDCMVLDLGLPDMTGVDLIKQIRVEKGASELPIIVYTGKALTKHQESELRRLADTIIVKDVKSPERLLAETTLFLHRVQANLPETKQRMLEQVRLHDPILTGKRVLIVDDDVRNIFALTSLLERQAMEVLDAENGRDGLAVLEQNPNVDILLIDVMMPEMDGYEAMRQIRSLPAFKSLPIIALTAKAMKGDREKCIEAGASDYIAKPVDPEQMLSLLRVWLYR